MERDICLKLLGTSLLYATNVVTAHTAWLWYKNLFWHWKKGKMWCTKFKTQQNVMLLKGCHSLHNNQLVIWHDSIAWKWHLKLPVIAVQSHLTKLILSNTSKANARLDIFTGFPQGKSQFTTEQCFLFFLRWFCLLSWALTWSHLKCQTFLWEINQLG